MWFPRTLFVVFNVLLKHAKYILLCMFMCTHVYESWNHLCLLQLSSHAQKGRQTARPQSHWGWSYRLMPLRCCRKKVLSSQRQDKQNWVLGHSQPAVSHSPLVPCAQFLCSISLSQIQLRTYSLKTCRAHMGRWKILGVVRWWRGKKKKHLHSQKSWRIFSESNRKASSP